MRDNEFEWALWAGTVGYGSTIDGRLTAAVEGGFSRISVSPIDIASADCTAAELGRKIRDAGVAVELEGFMSWYPGESTREIPLAAFGPDEVLEMAAALRPVALTVLARPTCDLPVAEVAGHFATVCDRAADFGAAVQLEFMPALAIGDLPSAREIVETAGRDNGGLVFDTWHFFRGNPDYAALESLSGDRVFAVQVSDGGETVQGSLFEDTFLRRMPGDGCFDLLRVLRELDRIGALRLVGPEVISAETAAMAPIDAAKIGRERTMELLSAVRS